MTRIISGRARGLRLDVPDAGTRPTSDRVRESLFGALESLDLIEGARVLDLYSGSGALALEALSRGAAHADLVEKSRTAAKIIRKNVANVKKALGTNNAHIHERSVRSFLTHATGPYDLVFSDPPYDLSDTAMTEDLKGVMPLLTPDAVVIVERGKRDSEPDFSAAGLVLLRRRDYGDTSLWWAEPAASASR